MYSVKSRSGRRGTVLTNYAHDMTRLMLRAPISWFSSGPVSNVKMGRNVRQRIFSDKISVPPEHAAQSVKQETPFCVKIGHVTLRASVRAMRARTRAAVT